MNRRTADRRDRLAPVFQAPESTAHGPVILEATDRPPAPRRMLRLGRYLLIALVAHLLLLIGLWSLQNWLGKLEPANETLTVELFSFAPESAQSVDESSSDGLTGSPIPPIPEPGAPLLLALRVAPGGGYRRGPGPGSGEPPARGAERGRCFT